MPKNYTRRDSATAWLRKLGIPATEYNDFITTVDGQFQVDDQKATARMASAPTTESQQVQKPSVRLPEPKPLPTPKTHSDLAKPKNRVMDQSTISGMTRSLIMAGMPNSQIWDQIKSKFNLSDSKKNYPSWYRSELRRKGYIVEKSKDVERGV